VKKILITGVNGFIGKNFIEQYKNKYEIIQVTRNSEFDILDLNTLLNIDEVEIVLHFAAKTFVPDSFDNPYDFYDFNIKSTLNITEFCRLKKVKKIIYLNSYTYGNPKYLPIDEKHPVSFHSPYNKSKYIAEQLLFQYLENISDVISLRLFNIYGKYQSENFLIPTIFKQISNDAVSVKDLKPKRDYLYIKDLIELLNTIINKNHINGIFNVGSGKSISVEEILNTIKDVLNSNLNIISENITRNNEVMDCVADIEKLEKEFSWSPKYSLKDGIIDYLNEVKNV
jgi:UDP-glucose 4-epimerase